MQGRHAGLPLPTNGSCRGAPTCAPDGNSMEENPNFQIGSRACYVLAPHPPAPSSTQCGCPSFAGGRGAITGAMSLSPFTWERDGLPKRNDASRVRGNLDIKVHDTH